MATNAAPADCEELTVLEEGQESYSRQVTRSQRWPDANEEAGEYKSSLQLVAAQSKDLFER